MHPFQIIHKIFPSVCRERDLKLNIILPGCDSEDFGLMLKLRLSKEELYLKKQNLIHMLRFELPPLPL